MSDMKFGLAYAIIAKKHGVGGSDLYSLLITGLNKAGRILEGDELVQEMIKKATFPTYMCVLTSWNICVSNGSMTIV
ncbi:putative pentatricopeptide [Helianthus debilis subsp. tardiflorus]